MAESLEHALKSNVGKFLEDSSLFWGIYYARKFVEGFESYLVAQKVFGQDEMQRISRLHLLTPPFPYLSEIYDSHIEPIAKDLGEKMMASAIGYALGKPCPEFVSDRMKEEIVLVYQKMVICVRFLLLKRNNQELELAGITRKSYPLVPTYAQSQAAMPLN